MHRQRSLAPQLRDGGHDMTDAILLDPFSNKLGSYTDPVLIVAIPTVYGNVRVNLRRGIGGVIIVCAGKRCRHIRQRSPFDHINCNKTMYLQPT